MDLLSGRASRWLLPLSALCLMAGILLGRITEPAWPALAGCGLCLAACFVAPAGRRQAALCALFLCLGAALGQAAWHPALPEPGEVHVRGVVAEEIRSDGKRVRTVLRDVSIDGKPFPAGAYWSFYADEVPEGLAPGRTVEAVLRLYHPGGAANPGGYDFREYLLQRGVTVGLFGGGILRVDDGIRSVWSVTARVRHRLTDGLIRTMGEESGGYAAALLLGVRSLVPGEDREAFSRLGIAHLLSVSGFHVAVLAGLLSLLLRLLRAPGRLRLALLALFLGAYCLLCGLGSPVIRASLLFLLADYGLLRCRQRQSLHLLSAACILTLLFSPAQLTGASFQMTYAALLGLVLVRPRIKSLLRPEGKVRAYLWDALASSLAVQAGILLPLLYWYQEWPVLGILFNIPALAFGSLLIAADWLALALLPVPWLGSLAGQLAALLTRGLILAVRTLSRQPLLNLWTPRAGLLTALGWAALLTGFGLKKLRPGRRAALLLGAAAVMAVSLVPPPHRGSEYIQLSVGNEDAAVLRDEGFVLVVDTGEDGLELAAYLKQRRLSVDALVLTHLHTDHCGGVRALLDEGIPIRRAYMPWGAESAALHEDVPPLIEELRRSGTELLTLARGDSLSLPGGSLTVLWPEAGRVRPGLDANESSLCALLSLHGNTLLLTGDLDGRYELYAAHPADLLKVAHHGSAGSTSAEFLAAVDPGALILSCGDESRRQNIAGRAPGVPLYCTLDGGAVTVLLGDGGYRAPGTDGGRHPPKYPPKYLQNLSRLLQSHCKTVTILGNMGLR